MSLFRLILSVVIAFVLYRIGRSVLRILSNRPGPDHNDPIQSQKPHTEQRGSFTDIRDADFEDIPAKKEQEEPHLRQPQ